MRRSERWARGSSVVGRRARDQPRAAAMRREADEPADEHEDAVLEADEVEEMDEEPGDPGEEAAELQSPQVGDRGCASDSGEVALVVVAERPRATAANAVANDTGRVASLLHRHRGDTWQDGVVQPDHVTER